MGTNRNTLGVDRKNVVFDGIYFGLKRQQGSNQIQTLIPVF